MIGGLRTRGVIKTGSKKNPLISIITVVFNGEKYLEQAILSVAQQTYKNIEYIIIDGGSKDKSTEIIKNHEDVIDFWISEKDRGIYNAMNKGIKLSRGDFIGFVNSDDYLYKDTILKLANAIKNDSIDYSVGPVDIISQNKKFKETALVLPDFLNKERFIFNMATHHLSFYVSRKIINEIGHFDENFKIRSDYDMTINVMSLSKKYFKFIESVGAFREGGISGSYKTYLESFHILRKHDITLLKITLNIVPSLIKVFINKNLPLVFVKWLREKFSSGRYSR